MKNFVKIGLTTLVLAGLCACSGPSNQTKTNNAANNKPVESQETTTTNNKVETTMEADDDGQAGAPKAAYIDENGYPVKLSQALDAFAKQYPNAQVTGISFEEENGNFVYDIEGEDANNDYELRVHASSGEILKQDQEPDNNKTIQALDLSQVKTEQEAMAAAKKEAKDDSLFVESWSLEIENSEPIYEVSLEDANHKDLDVKLDAKTLQLIEIDQ